MTAPTSDVTDDPNTWGYLKNQSVNGRSSTYERYYRDRFTTLTHVYWTEETAGGCASCDRRVYR